MKTSFAELEARGRRAFVAGGIASLAGSAALAQPAPQVVNNVVVGRDGWLFSSFGEPGRGYVQAVDKGVCDVVMEAAKLLKAARIEPVIALIPAKNRLYRQFISPAAPPPEFQRRYAFLLAELRRNETLVPDLEASFRRAASERPAEGLYFRSDTHWTPRGAELCAAELARAIRESRRLPASTQAGTRLAEPVTQTHPIGDLQRLLPVEMRTQFAPEEYRIRLPAQAAGLLDDAAGDVAAIGSSFLEPRYAYVHALSNQLQRPVQLAWRPNTVGPWMTLIEYLRSPEFRRNRPRLIAWHHLEINMASGPNVSDWGRNAMPPQAFLGELHQLLGA